MKEKIESWLSSRNNKLELLFFLLLLFLPTQFGKHFWPDFSFIYGIRIDYLSPTLYVTDIIVFLIIFFGLKRKYLNKKIFLFLIPFLFSGFFAIKPLPFLYGALKLLEFFLLGIIIAKEFKINDKVIKVFSLSIFFESFLAIWQFLNHGSIGSIFYFFGERTFSSMTPGIANASINGALILRPYGTLSHPNVLAAFLLVGMILVLTSIFTKKNSLLYGFVLVVSSIALLLTLSRLPIIIWFLFLIYQFMLEFKKKKKTKILLLFLIFLTFSIVYFYFPRFLFGLKEEAFVQRYDLIINAINVFLYNPVFGVGLNNLLFYTMSFPKTNTFLIQPVHNIFLIVLTESGFIGLSVFIFFLVKTYLKLFFYKSKRPILLALSALLFLGFFDHYALTLQQGQLLFTLLLAFAWSKI